MRKRRSPRGHRSALQDRTCPDIADGSQHPPAAVAFQLVCPKGRDERGSNVASRQSLLGECGSHLFVRVKPKHESDQSIAGIEPRHMYGRDIWRDGMLDEGKLTQS